MTDSEIYYPNEINPPLSGEWDGGRMTKQKQGTRLSCEVTDYEGKTYFCEVGNNAWDNSIADMFDLFGSLLMGLGYSEYSVNELLNSEDEEEPEVRVGM